MPSSERRRSGPRRRVLFRSGDHLHSGDLFYQDMRPVLVVSWRTIGGQRVPYISFPLDRRRLKEADRQANTYRYEGPLFSRPRAANEVLPPETAEAEETPSTGPDAGSRSTLRSQTAMPSHDFDQARAVHSALAALFVAHAGGKRDVQAMEHVSRLCYAGVAAINDVECRVGIRGVLSMARLLFSDDGYQDVQVGNLSGPAALRFQISNSLSAFRGRLDALERRPPSRPELPAIAATKQLRILVVEDNRDSADSLRKLLELCGYAVTVAYTGEQGLDAALRTPPDVVLCDIALPDRDGFSVASALRQHPSTSNVRLIAVTAYGSAEDQKRSHDAGFQLHLVKPVRPDALLEQLDPNGASSR